MATPPVASKPALTRAAPSRQASASSTAAARRAGERRRRATRVPQPACEDVGGDVELVPSPGHDADRHAEGQRLLGDAHAAVADDRVGLAQDRHVGEEAGDDRVAGIAEARRVDPGGGDDDAVAVAQAGERRGGDRAVVLELRGAADEDQGALVLRQVDRRLRRRVPEARPDHRHARRQVARVVEGLGGVVDRQRRAVAEFGGAGERRQPGGAAPGVDGGQARAAVEAGGEDPERAVAQRPERRTQRPDPEPERRPVGGRFFEQRRLGHRPAQALALGQRLGAEGGRVDDHDVGTDLGERRFEVRDLVPGATAQGAEGAFAGGHLHARLVVVVDDRFDLRGDRRRLEPGGAHHVDARRERPHVDLGAAPVQLQQRPHHRGEVAAGGGGVGEDTHQRAPPPRDASAAPLARAASTIASMALRVASRPSPSRRRSRCQT